jgi:hypothetical protein
MKPARAERQLAETGRHIAEAKVLISRQRAALARTLAMGYTAGLPS